MNCNPARNARLKEKPYDVGTKLPPRKPSIYFETQTADAGRINRGCSRMQKVWQKFKGIISHKDDIPNVPGNMIHTPPLFSKDLLLLRFMWPPLGQ